MQHFRFVISLLCLVIGLSMPAMAHRLDEYLQATAVALARDHVQLDLRLTPGVSVAQSLLAEIDVDRDGRFSESEQRHYAGAVQHDLQLEIDDRPTPLRLTSLAFPLPRAILDGVGDIDLQFDATVPTGTSSHVLALSNRHRSALAVYLVNTLQPLDDRIQVTSQHRAFDQSSYRLGFTTDATAPAADPVGANDVWATVATFFVHGVRHILTGYDHLLFVAALVLGAASLWDLVKVVTAFTVAHSITLVLAVEGWVHLPAQLVELVISASIVFVAAQNLGWPQRSHGPSRLAVAFLFGLFHGLGFAGGLLDLMHQMPREALVFAFIGFAFGVEAGNQAVLLPLYALVAAARSGRHQRMAIVVQRTGSAIIAAGGLYFLGRAVLAA